MAKESIQLTKKSCFWGGLCLLVALAGLFPGDVPWINDEALLFLRAYYFNLNGQIADLGLTGTVGLPYGPVPTWIYQICLLATHKLTTIVSVKTLTITLILLCCTITIARACQWELNGSLLLLCSPYLYLYNRLLWDNPFIVPFSAALILCYVFYIKNRTATYLYLISLLAFCLTQIHLMSFFIILPIIGLMLCFDRSLLKAHLIHVVLSSLIYLVLSTPYLYVVYILKLSTSTNKISLFSAVISSLSSFKLYSFSSFNNYFFPELISSNSATIKTAAQLLVQLSKLSAIFFLGGVISFLMKCKIIKSQNEIVFKLALLSLSSIVLSALFHCITRKEFYPHYHLPLWFSGLFFMWLFINQYKEHVLVRGSFYLHIFSCICLLILFISRVHQLQGNRSLSYGATLNQQLKLVKEYSQYPPDTPVIPLIKQYQLFPHAFQSLYQLNGTQATKPTPASNKQLVIDWKNSLGGEIELRIQEK